MPAQKFLVPSTLHSAPSASLSKRLPAHYCSADLVVDIGPVAGICLTPPAAHVLAIHVAAPAAAAVMTFQARPADLLSPAQAHVTKRLRASSKQDIKNVTNMAEAGRATHHKDALHHDSAGVCLSVPTISNRMTGIDKLTCLFKSFRKILLNVY